MKKVIYISAILAGTGSLLAIINGHGSDPLGVWNYRGPMSKGQIFNYILIVSAVIITSPFINHLLKLKKQSNNSKWEQRFLKEFENGMAKRVPSRNQNDEK
jgi:hypothetical protein